MNTETSTSTIVSKLISEMSAAQRLFPRYERIDVVLMLYEHRETILKIMDDQLKDVVNPDFKTCSFAGVPCEFFSDKWTRQLRLSELVKTGKDLTIGVVNDDKSLSLFKTNAT